MTDRERFLATMHYRPRDRAPICDFGFWAETIEIWKDQGLPEHWTEITTTDFLGMDRYDGWTGIDEGLFPRFPERVVEERGEEEVVQGEDGVQVLRHRFMSSIPMHVGHLLVDRSSWERLYKPRLDPSTPGRFPPDWERSLPRWKDPQRPYCRTLAGGSLYGALRNWMGVEALSYVVYDDPAWFEDMVETLCVLTCSLLEKALATGVVYDACGMWEDMCYSGGPLLSVEHFRRYLVPRYRRISDLLRRCGTDIIWVDCDGDISQLVPHWLEAGINTMFPVEVGTWRADPVAMRKEYGRDLLMMGGFDKRILSSSKQAIEEEVDRLTPLVEDGGYIPFCDHRVPPDVTLDNYLHYLALAKRRWGRGIDLKPMFPIYPKPNLPEPT